MSTIFSQALINLSFISFLSVVPSAERIDEVMPYLQASGFALMILNNGLQATKHIKGDDC